MVTKVVEVLDRIKSDRSLKNQIIRACVIFSVVFIIVMGLVLSSEEEEVKVTNSQNQERYDFIPADTSSIEDKTTLYKKMDWAELNEESDVEIVNNEDIFGEKDNNEKVHENRNDNVSTSVKETNNNTSIDDYIAQRRRVREQQQAKSYASERNYNPYGNTKDWEERQPNNQIEERQLNNQLDNTETYVTMREQQVQQQKTSSAPQRKKDPYDFESLSEAEKKRIILTTGQATYQESSEISAMIMSSGMIKSGQTITLTTKEPAVLSLEKIPKGTNISGVVSFNENRLQVQFSTMRLKNKIIKVDLVLYALDGLEGLPVSSDVMSKEIEDTGIEEATAETSEYLGKAGRIANQLLKSNRRKEEIKVDLGRDIMCILVNKRVNN